ncbi:405_t:CDS:2, partial [Funneliformis geosporum]
IPYVDPKTFSRRSNDNTLTKFKLNEKSDFYSVGVLLWELSSGRPPFYVKDEEYNISLTIEILGGLREKIIPDTPEDYLNIYTGIIKLNAIIAITSIASIAENNQSNNYKSNLQQHFCVT